MTLASDWGWPALFFLGAYHGLNPGMGWLFAVALGMLGAGYAVGARHVSGTVADAVQASPAGVGRDDVELIVRDYLLKNPELLVEVQAALDAKQKEEQRLAALGVIKNAKADIFNSDSDGVVGNPNGKVTIVEFYDYNCAYCRHAIQDMRNLTAADPDLRVQRQIAQKRHAHRCRGPFSAALSEDIDTLLRLRSDHIAHVLDNAEHGNVDLLEHRQSAPRIDQ